MTETLSQWSNIVLYIAIAVYSLAFVLFTFDLAGRGARTGAASSAAGATGSAAGATARDAERELVGVGAASGAAGAAGVEDAVGSGISATHVGESAASTAGLGGATGAGGASTASFSAAKASVLQWRDRGVTKFLPVAFVITIVAWALHLVATVLRGVAAARVPWSNMFEFSLTATAIIVGVFIFIQLWQDLRFLGAFITGFTTLVLGIATIGFYVDVVPLQPALQSVWLVIHVFVATLSTGFLALGFGLSVVQLLQQRREAAVRAGVATKLGWLSRFPASERLEDMSFRLNVIGFIFWTFTLVAGAVWAERAWGRPWGWDTKEVWTFIIWVVYAGYLHARGTRGWRGAPSAWLSIVGFACVMFNFGVVNVFFKGLHAYSGL